MRSWIILTLLFGSLPTGCITSAPTTRELGRRSEDSTLHEHPSADTFHQSSQKTQTMRSLPVVERVYVFPQPINSHAYFEGAWVQIEVVPSGWQEGPQ